MKQNVYEEALWTVLAMLVLAIVLLTVAFADMKTEIRVIQHDKAVVERQVSSMQSELSESTSDNAQRMKKLEDEVLFFISGGWK